MVLYLVVDVRGRCAWAILVRPAGAQPLIAYLLHPIILFSLSLTGLSTTIRSYAQGSPAVTILGSLGMAAVVCGLTGLIARAGLWIRV
jgi:heparan-alpha-glucosaminide N-acetyltransferase